MRLTSRERVLAAFDHVEPDRVPAWCGSSAEFWAKAKAQLGLDDEGLRIRFGDDFRRVWARYAGPEVHLQAGAIYATPFSIQRHGMGYGQPMSHPLADATIEQIHDYPWPDPDSMDVSAIRDEALAHDRQYAILGGDWSPFWHDAIDLLGMENLLLRMYDEPDAVHAVLQHIVDYYAAVSERIFEAAGDAIDIFFIGNDFGSQTGPLLGEDLFRQFCLPPLRWLIDLGHSYDLKVMMHCCGGFSPLIPAMIEIGLDGLHAVQPSCQGMDLAALKRTYGRQMVFNGASSPQDARGTRYHEARRRLHRRSQP